MIPCPTPEPAPEPSIPVKMIMCPVLYGLSAMDVSMQGFAPGLKQLGAVTAYELSNISDAQKHSMKTTIT